MSARRVEAWLWVAQRGTAVLLRTDATQQITDHVVGAKQSLCVLNAHR